LGLSSVLNQRYTYSEGPGAGGGFASGGYEACLIDCETNGGQGVLILGEEGVHPRVPQRHRQCRKVGR
jgi:hypothetical protein